MNQKEAVFAATMGVLADRGEELKGDIKQHPDAKAIKVLVVAIVVEGFRSGTVTLDTDFDDAELKKYTGGLVNNWWRKDTRLTDGVKYVTKNPGSRAHVGSAEVKELRNLRAVQEAGGASTEMLKAIDDAIAAATAEHAAKKAPTVDLSKISPELLAKLGIKAS